jgi:cytochrome c551/c552
MIVFSCSSQSGSNEGKKKEFSQVTSEVQSIEPEVALLMQKNACSSCHDLSERRVGPSYKEIAERKYTAEEMVNLIYNPKPSNWPEYKMPMIAMPSVPKDEALKIAQWINSIQ